LLMLYTLHINKRRYFTCKRILLSIWYYGILWLIVKSSFEHSKNQELKLLTKPF